MKKIISITLLICMVLSMAACEGQRKNDTWEPELASTYVRPYAERAIEIIDDYLHFEMNSDEANSAFEELNNRIESLDVDMYSQNTNSGDAQIAMAIRHVDRFCFSILSTDEEVCLYRDIISYQIGEEVSGKTYEAERVVSPEGGELLLGQFLDIENAPFSSSWVYHDEASDSWYINLKFDKMNDVSLASLDAYIAEILGSADTKGIDSIMLTISYNVYAQEAATVYIIVQEDSFYGYSLRSWHDRKEATEKFQEQYTQQEISNMEEIPDEYSVLRTLCEIESIEELSKLLEETSKYVGIE